MSGPDTSPQPDRMDDPREDSSLPDLGWALVRNDAFSGGHILVRVIARGKRFADVRSSSGMEWRETARSLWTVATRELGEEQIRQLCEIEREAASKARGKEVGDV